MKSVFLILYDLIGSPSCRILPVYALDMDPARTRKTLTRVNEFLQFYLMMFWLIILYSLLHIGHFVILLDIELRRIE